MMKGTDKITIYLSPEDIKYLEEEDILVQDKYTIDEAILFEDDIAEAKLKYWLYKDPREFIFAEMLERVSKQLEEKIDWSEVDKELEED